MPLVFVFFSVRELPLPLAMGMGMLSFWKDWLSTNTFECPLSWLEPGFLILGLGKKFPREASKRRRNGLFSMISRRGEGIGAWELRTEMEMVFPKVPEFHFASMMMMASSATVAESQTFSSSSDEKGIALSFSRPENRITFSFSRVENGITFSFSEAGGQAEQAVGYCGELNLIEGLLLLLAR